MDAAAIDEASAKEGRAKPPEDKKKKKKPKNPFSNEGDAPRIESVQEQAAQDEIEAEE